MFLLFFFELSAIFKLTCSKIETLSLLPSACSVRYMSYMLHVAASNIHLTQIGLLVRALKEIETSKKLNIVDEFVKEPSGMPLSLITNPASL